MTEQRSGQTNPRPNNVEPTAAHSTQTVNSDPNTDWYAKKRAEAIHELYIRANSLFPSDSTAGPTVVALCTLIERWILADYKESVRKGADDEDLEYEEGILTRTLDAISGLAMIGDCVATIDLYPEKKESINHE